MRLLCSVSLPNRVPVRQTAVVPTTLHARHRVEQKLQSSGGDPIGVSGSGHGFGFSSQQELLTHVEPWVNLALRIRQWSAFVHRRSTACIHSLSATCPLILASMAFFAAAPILRVHSSLLAPDPSRLLFRSSRSFSH